MFIGHYAVALAAKKAAPRTSLGTLIAAAIFLDLLWPVLVLVGIERVNVDPAATAFTPLDFAHYPWSHSLLMSVVWGAILGLLYHGIRNYPHGAAAVAALVVSHWLLDLPMHRPDLPLTPWGETRLGFGLWNNVPATVAIEFLLFAGGALIYATSTRSRDHVGAWGFAVFLTMLAVIYAAAGFGPPPPDATSVAWTAQAQWLFVVLAAWFDAHRSSVR
jgi:membrane-bound metal-dependent hydrolase YbcI (DUF457 family)